jgi:hypothetical protein
MQATMKRVFGANIIVQAILVSTLYYYSEISKVALPFFIDLFTKPLSTAMSTLDVLSIFTMACIEVLE